MQNLSPLLGSLSVLVPASQVHLWDSSNEEPCSSALAISCKSEVNRKISHFREGRQQNVGVFYFNTWPETEISREQWDAMLSFALLYLPFLQPCH